MLKKLHQGYLKLMCKHKWVDKTKPDDKHYRIGCRLCGKEVRLSAKTPKSQREK